MDYLSCCFLLLVPCNYREKCTFGEWGSWEGNIKTGTPGCYKQMRTKPYQYPLQTQLRRFSCGGLNIDCNLPPVEKRMQCKFSYCHVFEPNTSCCDHAQKIAAEKLVPLLSHPQSGLLFPLDRLRLVGSNSTLVRNIPWYQGMEFAVFRPDLEKGWLELVDVQYNFIIRFSHLCIGVTRCHIASFKKQNKTKLLLLQPV